MTKAMLLVVSLFGMNFFKKLTKKCIRSIFWEHSQSTVQKRKSVKTVRTTLQAGNESWF